LGHGVEKFVENEFETADGLSRNIKINSEARETAMSP
jgi:hypothetical protein